MNVISKTGLKDLVRKHRSTADDLAEWHKRARKAEWRRFADVRKDFPSADQVGAVLIFDIQHNQYRLIARVNYLYRTIYVKDLLTHKEYDRKEWMKWA